MAKFNDKISTLINSQLPDFVVDDHPQFVQFLKTYFTFMESAELQVTSIESTDGITLENETGRNDNLLLDGSKISSERTQLDADDKIILEDSSFGKFTVGEIITGVTSNATATVVAEDLANNRIFTSAQDKFIKGEIVTGNSSNAQAVINNYRPNPVQNIQQLLNFRDPDKVISDFLTKFRNEFLKTIPEELAIGLDKRNLIKNIKSMYRLKGTQKGHELFFRILFNEASETFYPRTQMLRVSDGNWDTQKVLRAVASVGDTTDLVGRTITGKNSGATAIVESIKKFIIGSKEISEFIVNTKTLNGTFIIGEEITGTSSDLDDYFIKANITGIPGTKTIVNDGNLYDTTDIVTVTGGGVGASFTINDLGSGGIEEVIVDDGGSGYNVGDLLQFDNTGTQGVNAAGFVAVVGGGLRQESGTTGTDGEDHIVLEDETTRGDQYFGNKIVQETETGPNLGDVENDITDIYLTNNGSGYKTLPSVSVISSTGTGSNVLAYGAEIGRVIGLKTNELGEGYEASPTPPTITFRNNLILTSVTGSFATDDTITGSLSGATGTQVSFDDDRNLLKVKDVTNSFIVGETVTSTSGGSADAEYNNGALIAENNGTVFDRALTVNGLKLVVAGAVGGQLAVPDEWAKKTARTFELMTDPNGAGINTTHQRNFIKTLRGDAGTYHAGIPTVQRVGYGGGSTYTPNWLQDVNVASYAGLQAFNDSVAQKDMVWYKNINGNNPPTQRRDIEEIFEHVFHTVHAFGIPGAVPGSIDAVEMNPDIRISMEPSFDWQNTAIHLAMKEAIDAGLYDPSGYAPDWNTDPEKAAVAYTEYTYLVNWSMWDMSVYWDGGSLSPEWDDSLKTPAGMLANNPLGYALFNTYFAPVLSKPNFATIESIFGENDTGVSGYVVDSLVRGSATLKKLDVANAIVNVVSVGDTDGKFLNEDGFVSESTMKIQDSLYYQDFSYVIEVRSIY
jgi:hypothetical protein